MIRKNPTELWRPTCRCLWPDWMSCSQGTQSLFRAWINGSWLDFGGLLRCFCLLWHRPPLCEVSLLLSDKGTTFFEKRKTENEETAIGGGDHWEGMSRLFLHHVVFFRTRRGEHLCFYVLILHTPVCVCMCVSMGQQWMYSPGTQFVKYQRSVSSLQWNMIFFIQGLLWDFSIFLSSVEELWNEWRTWWQRQTSAHEEESKISVFTILENERENDALSGIW